MRKPIIRNLVLSGMVALFLGWSIPVINAYYIDLGSLPNGDPLIFLAEFLSGWPGLSVMIAGVGALIAALRLRRWKWVLALLFLGPCIWLWLVGPCAPIIAHAIASWLGDEGLFFYHLTIPLLFIQGVLLTYAFSSGPDLPHSINTGGGGGRLNPGYHWVPSYTPYGDQGHWEKDW